MKIRTVTIGIPFNQEINVSQLQIKIKKVFDEITPELEKRNIQIRTKRINLSPVRIENCEIEQQRILDNLNKISELCDALNIRWFNVPFDVINVDERTSEDIFDLAFDVLRRYSKVFVNFIVADNNEINYSAITRVSKFIKNVSSLDNSGYHNFRVGASCNTKPNSPFFPYTFSSQELGFSIGLELPQEFVNIIEASHTNDLFIIRKNILETLTPKIVEIDQISKIISQKNAMVFHGIDLSLAPFPDEGCSVAALIEKLGLEQQGCNGTLFITSYLTDILKSVIKQGEIKSTGFNGVMFSLLEDDCMGKRNNNNIYSIDSLISYSAVCGCGLDMVPLPGDIFEEEISAIILDIAALSTTLNKPLGVRLLPIPMKQENEFTTFNMDFLFNTRIKKIKNIGIFNLSLKKDSFHFLSKQRTPSSLYVADNRLNLSQSSAVSSHDIKQFWETRANASKDKPIEDAVASKLEEDPQLLKLKLELENKKVAEYVTLKPTDLVVDLGSGQGYWAEMFAKVAKKVYAVEFCAEFVEQAKKSAQEKNISNIECIHAPAQDFKSDLKFDFIFISGLMVALVDDDFEKLLKNIFSFSKKGTLLILRDGTGIKGRHEISNKYSEVLKTKYSAIYRTREEYITAFENIGFKLIKDENMFVEDCCLNKYPETRLRIYQFIKVK